MILQTLKIIDKFGVTIATFDEVGVKDTNDFLIHGADYVSDRLFATPLAAYVWTCTKGVWKVTRVNAKYSVVGGTGCTVDVLVSSGIVAPGDGVTQLTAALSLTTTAPFSVNGVLIATPTLIQPGDSVARVIAGTPGSLEGLITVEISRVQ